MEKTTLPPFVLFVSQSEATRYSPNFVINVGELGHAKRGDWVRLMVRFPHHCEYCGKAPSCGKEGKTDYEVLSAKLWAGVSSAGLAKVRVLSRPVYTGLHSLDYQDDLTLSANYILDYVELKDPATVAAEDYLLTGVLPESKPIFNKDELGPGEKPRPLYDGATENQKLRDRTKSMPALAPTAGKRYWLRNGAEADIWTLRNGVYLGKVVDGPELEWLPSGEHHQGKREFDVVKDPAITEVVNA